MAQSKNGYIPPSVQRAMDQNLQHMPANLQKYQSGNTYIPSGAAKSMANYMQKSMPAHMKEYIAPYMQQKVTAGLNSLDPVTTRTPQPRAPVPNLMRRDHSGFGEQFTVNMATNNQSKPSKSLSYAPQYSSTQNNAPPAPPPAPMPGGSHNPYEFIMSGNQKPKRSFGGSSMKQRIIIAIGGIGVILIALAVFISLIGSSSSGGTNTLLKLVQQQNEIARVAGLAKDKATNGNTKNLAITAQLSVQSDQVDTLALLKKNGHKVGTKQLALLQDSKTDQELTAASTAGTFDATFTQVLQSELTIYQVALQNAYRNSTRTSERQLLQASYNSVAYLLGNQKT